MGLGIGSKIKKEGKRFGGKVTTELERFGGKVEEEAKRYADWWDKEINKPLGLPTRGEYRKARREKKRAAAEQAALLAQQRRELATKRAVQAKTERLMSGEMARQRRLEMAEAITGEQFGMMSSTPVDGPNMEVNKIPVLDGIDDMGNSIPEV